MDEPAMVRITQAISRALVCAFLLCMVLPATTAASVRAGQLPTCTISGGPFYNANGTFNSNLAFYYTVYAGI